MGHHNLLLLRADSQELEVVLHRAELDVAIFYTSCRLFKKQTPHLRVEVSDHISAEHNKLRDQLGVLIRQAFLNMKLKKGAERTLYEGKGAHIARGPQDLALTV